MDRMSNTVYQIVTDQIIAQLDKGIIAWKKPWKPSQEPRNMKSGRPYRGINRFLLAATDFNSPFWGTKKNIVGQGGTIRDGEKGTIIVFWKPYEVECNLTGEVEKRFMFRYYRIWNADQCDGLDHLKQEESDEGEKISPIDAAEKVSRRYLENGGPMLVHGGDRAYYQVMGDTVKMPEMDSFHTADGYYSTLFHELGHSTGHPLRLNRPGIAEFDGFGSHQYADEELVAEFTAAFLMAETGIEGEETTTQSIAYIQSWREKLADDPRLVVFAAQRAQKAADMILDRQFKKAEVA